MTLRRLPGRECSLSASYKTNTGISMKRKKIPPGTKIEIRLNLRDRELLREHTFVDKEFIDCIREVPGESYLIAPYTLDDLEDVLGYIAAEANHTENRKLQDELDDLYDRLCDIEDRYDDQAG